MNIGSKKNTYHYLIAGVCVILGVLMDQWTKHLAIVHLKEQKPYVIFANVFELHYLENRGAAFGLLQNQKWFFLLTTVIFLIAIVWFYKRAPFQQRFLPLRMCAVLLASGAIGNLIDRCRYGYVVDFLYFKLIDFPIFNVADIFVTVAMGVLIVLILFYYKEEDFDQIFHH